MNARALVRFRVLILFLTLPALMGLQGCGGSEAASGPSDPTTQSVSKYEQEINKSKAANSKKKLTKAR
ncbi:hypothetical protein EP7_002683 [Isosphaeraceae bacterium EP7]